MEIILTKGLKGLEAASKQPGAWLPTVAGLGLLPKLMEAFGESSSDEAAPLEVEVTRGTYSGS